MHLFLLFQPICHPETADKAGKNLVHLRDLHLGAFSSQDCFVGTTHSPCTRKASAARHSEQNEVKSNESRERINVICNSQIPPYGAATQFDYGLHLRSG